MDLFQFLHDISEARHLPVVIIGGHAKNALGYSRTTFDLDLLVRKADVESEEYGTRQIYERIIQFTSTPPATQ